jgi:nucleoside-diphosphate-sugar epimerase
MSFDPEQMAAEIKKTIPEFVLDYQVDPVRQAIAESWPNHIDSSCAIEEWGFKTEYNLEKMTREMLGKLKVESQLVLT